jgi:hypothetical protein
MKLDIKDLDIDLKDDYYYWAYKNYQGATIIHLYPKEVAKKALIDLNKSIWKPLVETKHDPDQLELFTEEQLNG